jgi:hypothetical protein
MKPFGYACAAPIILALLFGSLTSAVAQEPPPIIPPTAQGSTDVTYPAGADGDALVVLEIVVEKDGTVSHATVVEGNEPFAEQARHAVLEWHFTPARRGDVPIAVRTRARVAFHQESDDSPETSPAPPQASSSLPAAPAPIEEVTVRGKRHEIGQMTISAEDVREMPGAFGDPFRAIDALPGVTPLLSGLPYFFIRGAPPNNNGYFLDGIRVPLLFHVGLGPGVIHPELLDRVELYPGAAPASYGRFAGAVVAGQTREPSTTFHGAANLRLVDAGALLESPFADGRGSALVAGRYGYPGPVVSAFSDATLGYWDYQSRVAWRLSERDTIGVFAFGSHDYLAHLEPKTGQTTEDFVSDFHRVDVRYDRAFVGGHARVAVTVGYDSQGAAPTYLTDTSGAIRLELERRLSPNVLVRGGADARLDAYAFEQGAPPDPEQPIVPSSVDPPPTNIAWGAHADVLWRVAPRIEIVPGARVDVFESSRRRPNAAEDVSTRVPAVDPRLSARVTLAPSVAWLSTIGLAHQYPILRVGSLPAPVVSGFGFPVGESRLQTVAQASQGVEIALPGDISATMTGFLSSWTALTDLTESCIQIEPAIIPPALGPKREPPPWTCPSEQAVHGRAHGLELLVRRPLTKRLSGWLSYTLSRSTRETHFITPEGGSAIATVPSEFDRTHVLNAILAYDLGRRWRAGGRFVFYTGAPYSSLSGNVPVAPYNNHRDPPFYRLDIRLEKRWPIGKNGSIAFVFEGQNVTLSKDSSGLGIDCIGQATEAGGTTTCKRATIGPIAIPSVGVEAFF